MRNIVHAAILAAVTLVTFRVADSLLPFSQAKIVTIDWLTAPGMFIAYLFILQRFTEDQVCCYTASLL